MKYFVWVPFSLLVTITAAIAKDDVGKFSGKSSSLSSTSSWGGSRRRGKEGGGGGEGGGMKHGGRKLSTICFPSHSEFGNADVELSGWYDNCDDQPLPVRIGNQSMTDTKTCRESAFTPTPRRVLLDHTGKTCYVNPLLDRPLDIFWLGPRIDPVTLMPTDDVTIYWIGFSARYHNGTFLALGQYMPKDCDDSGVCGCDTIESLREGWAKEGEDHLDWCHNIEVIGIDSCGSGNFSNTINPFATDEDEGEDDRLDNTERLDDTPPTHCVIEGQYYATARDNITINMFCALNFQIQYDSTLYCDDSSSPRSGGAPGAGGRSSPSVLRDITFLAATPLILCWMLLRIP